jgi:hypothetical protein
VCDISCARCQWRAITCPALYTPYFKRADSNPTISRSFRPTHASSFTDRSCTLLMLRRRCHSSASPGDLGGGAAAAAGSDGRAVGSAEPTIATISAASWLLSAAMCSVCAGRCGQHTNSIRSLLAMNAFMSSPVMVPNFASRGRPIPTNVLDVIWKTACCNRRGALQPPRVATAVRCNRRALQTTLSRSVHEGLLPLGFASRMPSLNTTSRYSTGFACVAAQVQHCSAVHYCSADALLQRRAARHVCNGAQPLQRGTRRCNLARDVFNAARPHRRTSEPLVHVDAFVDQAAPLLVYQHHLRCNVLRCVATCCGVAPRCAVACAVLQRHLAAEALHQVEQPVQTNKTSGPISTVAVFATREESAADPDLEYLARVLDRVPWVLDYLSCSCFRVRNSLT